MGRDYVAEIESIRSRAAGSGRRLGSARVTLELYKIATGALRSDQLSDADATFIIIRLVTIFEVFVRESVMEIVDAGSPYVERASMLISGGFKADFVVAAALAGQRVSFGELISHQISIKSLNDVSKIFSKLFDCDFLTELKSTQDRYSVEVMGSSPEPILINPGLTYSSMQELFSCRHVLVHELPEDGHAHITQAQEKYQAVHDMVNVIGEYVATALAGQFPLTQTDINIAAADLAAQADVELQRVFEAINSASNNHFLRKNQQDWLTYRLSTADLFASIVQGGTMWSSIYYSTYEKITRARLNELQEYFDTM